MNKNFLTVICEDNQSFAQNLKRLIIKNYPEIKTDIYTSGEALLLNGYDAEIYLLDLELPGINGIETAKRIRKNDEYCTIIFITGYDNKMSEAFDIHAHHYLLKPLNATKFLHVFESAVNLQISRREKNGDFVFVKANRVYKKVFLRDIKYIDCFKKKITLHTTNGELSFYKKLDEFECSLNENFFRCHRGTIVNMEYVDCFTSNAINLNDNTILNLSRRKFADFENAFLNFVKRETIG